MIKQSFAALLLATTVSACAPDTSTQSDTSAVQNHDTQKPQTKFEVYPAALFHQTTNFVLAGGGGLGFSHDGSKLLVSSDASGIFNTYTISMDGEATALTSSDDTPIFARAFFPHDDRVIVQGDQGGNELDHVYARKEDGSLHDLTPGDKLKAQFQGWHENGEVFYIATNERDPSSSDLYAYNASDFSRKLLFKNDKMRLGSISPDGHYLTLVKTVTSANADIFLVDISVENPKPVLITPHEGNIAYGTYTFTPDSSKLIYATNEFGEFNQAWSYDLASQEKTEFATADWDITNISYSPSGRYRTTSINQDAVSVLEIFDTETQKNVKLNNLPEGALSRVRFNADESMMAFGLNTDTSPLNIYTADLTTGDTKRLTSALPEGIDENNLVTASIVRYTSFDGLKIPGILYIPKEASAENPAPALVWVHGGPGGQSRKGYSATIQHLVNHGYAVLAANNRGSNGYGKTFYHLDDRKHGEEDLMDIVSARAYLESLEGIDKDKIGILGGSYGGFMTVAALAFHPEVFDVGVNLYGVTNWERTLQSIPAFWGAIRDALYDEMGDPETDQERHHKISPLFHAETITKPLYVAQGSNDPRVLQVESDEMVKAVRANGVPVEYVLFPDEGHGFLKRKNRITNSERIAEFLDTYLKGETKD
jgi:dipeptidyl aminopeptidase/acylaminoacyl peptidase